MFPCLKLKKIEERLQCICDFENPKILLEQYVTPWHLGSQMLYMIQVDLDEFLFYHIIL